MAQSFNGLYISLCHSFAFTRNLEKLLDLLHSPIICKLVLHIINLRIHYVISISDALQRLELDLSNC